MKNQQKIIPPVGRNLIEQELNEDFFIRDTNKGKNKIYIINNNNSPNIIKEIGRLREISFRHVGGGTGLEADIDEADTSERCYEQLIIYNPDDRQIIGGYRFILGEIALNRQTNNFELSTSHYFDFSKQMKEDFLPYSIELGRSWVQPDYQPANNPRKGLFALMNIWDGLGCLVTTYPRIKYFFGKVTMYKSYNSEARNILLSFMNHYFPNRLNLCHPKSKLLIKFDDTLFKKYFSSDMNYQQGYKLLHKLLKKRREFIPPLINIYMSLSDTMMTFGTAQNSDFGNVEETAILIIIDDIYQDVKDRHIDY